MSHVRYKENPAGQVKLDVDNVADGPHTVSRQVVRMAGSTLGALADVLDATPGSDAMGLVARVVGGATDAALALVQTAAEAIRDRLPAALVGGRLSVDVGASALPSGGATEATLSTRASESTLSTRAADATITARLGTLGQKAMTASAPVVIASDQSAVPVSAASLPLPSGAATESTLSTRAADSTVGAVRDRLPSAFTAGGGVKAGIVDALPSGTNTIGKVDQGAAAATGWPVNNDFTNAPEVLADQSGAGAVLTFTFSNSVVLVLVESLSGTTLVPGGLTCRITLGTSQTPTASLGVRCTDEKVYLPSHPITTVRVFAPSGTTVTCMGWRR